MNETKPILVVEDERDIRENMVMLLEDEGYTVYSASHGQEALAILTDYTKPLPALIALDFYMPVMDAKVFLKSFEAMREKRVGFSDITIVLVTAADEKARAGIEGKMVGILKKPVDIEAFLEIVRMHCGITSV